MRPQGRWPGRLGQRAVGSPGLGRWGPLGPSPGGGGCDLCQGESGEKMGTQAQLEELPFEG